MNYVAVRAALSPYESYYWSLQVVVSFSCPYCRQIICKVRTTDSFASPLDVFTASEGEMTDFEKILGDFRDELGCDICHAPSPFHQDDRRRFEEEFTRTVTYERIARGMAKRVVSRL